MIAITGAMAPPIAIKQERKLFLENYC